MVLAHAVAHDARGLLVGSVPRHPDDAHGVEHAAVHGLEAVSYVRERPAHDDGHGVVEVRLPHLLFDGNRRLALWAHAGPRRLDVEVDHVEGVPFDELAPRLHGVAHEDGEDLVGAHRVIHGHPEQRARLRIHGGFPELLGVHLAQSLVALERHPVLREVHHHLDEPIERVRDHLFAIAVHHRARALVESGNLPVALEELRVVRRLEEVGAEGGGLRPQHLDERGVAVVPAHELRRPSLDLARHLAHGGRDLAVPYPALGAPELLAQEPIEDGARHAPPRELGEERAELQRPLERFEKSLLLERLRLARDLDGRALDPLGEQEFLHLALAHQIPLRLALLDLEERRLRDKEPPCLDDRHHVPEKERQEQGPDVRAVHVGVRHQDHLVVAQLRDVEFLGSDARAQRGDQQSNFLMRQDLVVARLLRVDDLAAQWKHRLDFPVASLLGRAPRRIALHEEDLAKLGVPLGAVGQLRRQALVVPPALPGELACFAGRLAGLRGAHALVRDLARGGRILLEGLGEAIVDDLLHEPLNLGIPELRLRLPLELRIGDADGDDRGQSLAHVVARDRALERLQIALGLRITRQLAREGRAEAGEVGAAFARVDVVGEGENALLIAVVVLEGDLDLDIVLLAFEEEHLGMNRRLVLVQVLDELDDPALVEKGVRALVSLVLDDDFEAFVEEGELAEPIGERVEGKSRLLEDLRVRLEANDRAVLGALLPRRQLTRRHPILVALRPHPSAPADLEIEPLAQRIDDRDAHSMEAARHLVGRVLELASGVKHGQHHLRRRLARLLVRVHRYAAAIVAHRAGAVRVQDDLDAVAIAPHRLVHGVVDDLVDQVMQAIGARVADIHGGPLPDSFEAFEDLDVARRVGLCAHAAPPTTTPMDSVTVPPLTSHHAAPLPSGSPGSVVVKKTCPLPVICRSTRRCTSRSSSDSASSSRRIGELPTALATGPASARRRASTSSRCWPREPKLRMSCPSNSTTRSSRWGPTKVSPRRLSSSRRPTSAWRNSASLASGARADRYSNRTRWSPPAISGYSVATAVSKVATARRRRPRISTPILASCSSHGASCSR